MSSKTLDSIASDYLYNINPLARRIGAEIANTKDAHESLWSTLSLKEQNQALDDTIIKPEIALQYASKSLEVSKEYPNYYPKLRIQTGLKYICDETGTTLRWKDEHSAPFSFMTQSQMNLCSSDSTNNENLKSLNNCPREVINFTPNKSININESLDDNSSLPSSQISLYQSENYSDTVFSTEDCSTFHSSIQDNDNTDGIFSKLINKTSLLRIQNNSDDDMENLIPIKNSKPFQKNTDKNLMNISFIGHTKSTDTESTALLDTPSSFSSYQSSHLNMEHEIPKTGFEFLDNW